MNSVDRRIRSEIILNCLVLGLSAVQKNSTVNVWVYQKQEEAIFRKVFEYPKHPFAYVPGGLQNPVTFLLLHTPRISCCSGDLRSLVNRSRCNPLVFKYFRQSRKYLRPVLRMFYTIFVLAITSIVKFFIGKLTAYFYQTIQCSQICCVIEINVCVIVFYEFYI